MKKFTFLLGLLFASLLSFSQKQTDIWYFGTLAGLDFAPGSPTVITGSAMFPSEGCSVMSDANGSLLFYTDGATVWNKTHAVMPNGSNLNGGISSTQAALIVPSPTNTSLYYVFTTDEFGGTNGLQYSTVDITLDGGNGDVVTKNVLLQTPVTEKLTAVKDPDPTTNRYWVLAHGWNNNTFYAYPVTGAGVGTPVITNIGSVHTGTPQNTYGQMKYSPCGDKVALTIGYDDYMELFHFNTLTGVLSNSISIGLQGHVYGVEFSQDANKVYVSSYSSTTFPWTLQQFDISTWSYNPILVSQYTLTTSDVYGLQMGHDGKIYCSRPFNQYLGVINTPNALGAACNYVDNGIDLDPLSMGTVSSLSLPGFVTSYFMPVNGSCILPTTSVKEIERRSELSVYPNPSSGPFKLRLETPGSLEVYSATGALIEKHQVKGASTIELGQNYSPGIYIVKAFYNGTSDVIKLVKE
jgi:hypothetical protein